MKYYPNFLGSELILQSTSVAPNSRIFIHHGITTAVPNTSAAADIPNKASKPYHLRGFRAAFAAALEVEAAYVGVTVPDLVSRRSD